MGRRPSGQAARIFVAESSSFLEIVPPLLPYPAIVSFWKEIGLHGQEILAMRNVGEPEIFEP